jgi:hypothetical protein
LATLSTVLAPYEPWKPLSTPNAPGLLPSKLFSNNVIEGTVSNSSSVLALFQQTLSSLLPALQRLDPTLLAAPLIAPGVLNQVGALAPLGLLTSWAFPQASVA